MSGINQPPPPADLLKSIVGLPQAFIARVHHRHAAQRNGEGEGGRDSLHRRRKNAKVRASKSPIHPSISLPLSPSLLPLIDIFTSFKLCQSSIYSRY